MISDEASRALTIISAIDLLRQPGEKLWRSVAIRIVLEADERGDGAAVTAIRAMLASIWDRLEDQRLADREAVR